MNAYLQEIAGGDYTAKDFRTWGGTLIAGLKLLDAPPPGSRTQTARTVSRVITETAAELGNTPTICRKCYVHPVVLKRYAAGTLDCAHRVPRVRGLRAEERRVLGVLEQPDKRRSGTGVARIR